MMKTQTRAVAVASAVALTLGTLATAAHAETRVTLKASKSGTS